MKRRNIATASPLSASARLNFIAWANWGAPVAPAGADCPVASASTGPAVILTYYRVARRASARLVIFRFGDLPCISALL